MELFNSFRGVMLLASKSPHPTKMTAPNKPSEQKRRYLEIACFNVASALAAIEAGADRIELCAGEDVGGTTPSLEDVKTVTSTTTLPVYVMIRQRGGDFVYSDEEVERMKTDVKRFKDLTSGFVFGILDGEGKVDVERCREVMDCAEGMPWTFHRAFDEAAAMTEAMERIEELGIAAILTSGGKVNAVEGADALATLVAKSESKPSIIVGGGVRSSNIEELKRTTRATLFHSSALVDDTGVASKDEIRKMIEKLRGN